MNEELFSVLPVLHLPSRSRFLLLILHGQADLPDIAASLYQVPNNGHPDRSHSLERVFSSEIQCCFVYACAYIGTSLQYKIHDRRKDFAC